MTPEEILKHPARVLTQAQRECYFDHGYVGVESIVPADVLAELQAVTADFHGPKPPRNRIRRCVRRRPRPFGCRTRCCAA